MNKLAYFYFILLSITWLSAQDQSGIITYDIKMNIDLTTIPKDKVNYITKMVGYASKQEFKLSFNKNKSHFKKIDQLNASTDFNPKMEDIATAGFSSPEIYIDYENKSEIYIRNGTLVKGQDNGAKWDITTESKVIETYICYKAIQKIPVIDRNGKSKVKEVIAWFAPSLPYPYGPKNFYGLPGLILELTENSTTYLATKISLNKKEITIIFPKGKTVTKEEYDKKLKSQMGM